MNSGESGLRELEKQTRMPVAVRAEGKNIKHYNAEALATLMERKLIAVFGDTGTGKSFTLFSILEDHIELRADDDDWIKSVFGHDLAKMNELLQSTTKTRRSYLRKAHRVIYFDFDTMGVQPLFEAQTCNKALFNRIEYYPCSNWEDAYNAMRDGMEILRKHALEWGDMGCWVVVDNVMRAWSHCQADFVYSLTGSSMNTLMEDIRLHHPGRNSEARRVQADKINEKKDWAVINPAHNEEWVDVIVGSGYNVLFLSPPKQFEIEVGKQGGKAIKEKVNNLGGAKNNRHQMHYIWRKYVSEDGRTFYGEMTKTRYTGNKGNEISNPTWRRMRLEMERVEKEHADAKEIRHAQFDYYDDDELPPLGSMPVASITENLELTAPTNDLDLDLIDPDFTIDDTPFEGLANIDLTTPEIDVDLSDIFPGPKGEPPAADFNDLDIALEDINEEMNPTDTKGRILSLIYPQAKTDIDWIIDTAREKWSISEGDVDDVVTELLDEGVLYEPSLGTVMFMSDPQEEEVSTEDALLDMGFDLDLDVEIDLSDLEPPGEPGVPEPPMDTPDPESSTDEVPELTVDQTWIVSSKDKGRGAYHYGDCSVVKRMKAENVSRVKDVEGRQPCSKCAKDAGVAVEPGPPDPPVDIDDIELPEM